MYAKQRKYHKLKNLKRKLHWKKIEKESK